MASTAPATALQTGAMGRRSSAFSKRGVFALVAFGIIAFIALLYFIGSGQMEGNLNNGRAHAASKGITGYAALVRLLEAQGNDVLVSRSEGDLDNPALLVIAPPNFASEDEIKELLEKRSYQGPTLVILPKWFASRSQSDAAKPGWVEITTASGSMWNPVIDGTEIGSDMVTTEKPVGRTWNGTEGSAGSLPDSTAVQFIEDDAADQVEPLVTAGDRILAGLAKREAIEIDREKAPIDLTRPRGFDDHTLLDDGAAEQAWRVMIVAEPDLLNNWGLADEGRAQLALDIIEEARGNPDLPIVFDLTINGLGASKNLLTLAFEPPFLAATLCLILAMLLVFWRAFKRFGPALVSDPVFAFGKSQLVENGAGVIQRTGRMHLLTGPYAKLMIGRLARKLGLRNPDREQLDKALARRRSEPVSPHLAALENARHSKDILRAARALHSLERTITR